MINSIKFIPAIIPDTHGHHFVDGDEAGLVAALKMGSSVAFTQLYKNYSGALLGIIIRRVVLLALAEDVLQETFIKIAKHINRYNPAKGRLFTWMARTANNTAIDCLRNKAERNSMSCEDLQVLTVETERSHQVSMNTDVIDLKKLKNLLPLKQQKLIDLIYFEGFTHCEAAEKLNIPLGTIKIRLRYAILNLRRAFR